MADSSNPSPPSPGLSRIPFTVEAENGIRNVAYWMNLAGAISAVVGGLTLLQNLYQAFSAHYYDLGDFCNGIIKIILGAWLIQAAGAFRKVADTDEADQAYLVIGFRKLKSFFLLQSIFILLICVFVCAVVLLVFVGSWAQAT